jgi:hypothetical protein
MMTHRRFSFPLSARLRAFGDCSRAVAAIEMALVMPFLILMFLGSIEASRYFMISKRVSNAAANMAQLLATSTGDRHESGLIFIAQSRLLIPTLAEDSQIGPSYETLHPASLASIEFRPTSAGCSDNCTYEAFVTDSFSYDKSIGRACGKQQQISDESTPSFTGVPASLYGPGSVVVADFVYTFTPLFGARFVKNFVIHRAAFLAPRYLDTVKFQRNATRDIPVRWC